MSAPVLAPEGQPLPLEPEAKKTHVAYFVGSNYCEWQSDTVLTLYWIVPEIAGKTSRFTAGVSRIDLSDTDVAVWQEVYQILCSNRGGTKVAEGLKQPVHTNLGGASCYGTVQVMVPVPRAAGTPYARGRFSDVDCASRMFRGFPGIAMDATLSNLNWSAKWIIGPQIQFAYPPDCTPRKGYDPRRNPACRSNAWGIEMVIRNGSDVLFTRIFPAISYVYPKLPLTPNR
jgi:hypothetical protein